MPDRSRRTCGRPREPRLSRARRLAQNGAMTAPASTRSVSSAELVSFVPRLTLDWLRDHAGRCHWREVDGTLAFVDISGFTAMSEQLCSLGLRGRGGGHGGHERHVSRALLAVAYAQGGGLLKFGGDALLLLFYEGENHAARAARAAAFEMRRTLRAIGRPRTSAGAIQLKMHAWTAQRFASSSSSWGTRTASCSFGRARVRAGRSRWRLASEAGEILLSPETVARLGSRYRGRRKGSRAPAQEHHPRRNERWHHYRTSRASRWRSLSPHPSVRSCSRWGRSRASTGTRPSPSSASPGSTRRSRPRVPKQRLRRSTRLVRAVQGGRRRAQGHVPRKRHRSRRRAHHPRIGCPRRPSGTTRSGCFELVRAIVNAGTSASCPHRSERGPCSSPARWERASAGRTPFSGTPRRSLRGSGARR